jgi:heme/copper-type cytochrome/quinol oxidase subunit 3
MLAGMSEKTPAAEPDHERVMAAVRETRDDAAPFALFAAVILVLLAVVSRQAHWKLLGGRDLWWFWLVVAVPYVLLFLTLLLGLGKLRHRDDRRRVVIVLLTLVWLLTFAGVVLLVSSLVSPSGAHITGHQLLVSGAVVWLTDAVAFGLAFWELDNGGPVARALAESRHTPDFAFPQDDNLDLARKDWAPRLWDYFYVSITNSIAFSPTDSLPLTRPAKVLMAAESGIAAVTILLVAARAVNILA